MINLRDSAGWHWARLPPLGRHASIRVRTRIGDLSVLFAQRGTESFVAVRFARGCSSSSIGSSSVSPHFAARSTAPFGTAREVVAQSGMSLIRRADPRNDACCQAD